MEAEHGLLVTYQPIYFNWGYVEEAKNSIIRERQVVAAQGMRLKHQPVNDRETGMKSKKQG